MTVKGLRSHFTAVTGNINALKSFIHFVYMALKGNEWSASHPSCFIAMHLMGMKKG
jgi:hypothetical protein